MILRFFWGLYFSPSHRKEKKSHIFSLGHKSLAGSLLRKTLTTNMFLFLVLFFFFFLSNAFLCFPKLVSFSSPNIAETIRKLGKEELKPPLCPHTPVVVLQNWGYQTLSMEKPLLRMLHHPHISPYKKEQHLMEGKRKWDHFVPHIWLWWWAVGLILQKR